MKKNHVTIFLLPILSLFFCLSVFSAESVEIHGFISQGYLLSDHVNYLTKSKEGSFEFNEMGITFNSYLENRIKIGMQIFARDLGDLGNDEIAVDWVFADYLFYNWIGLRVGRMKIPHGFYNESRDSDVARTSIFLPQGVYNEPFRDSLFAIKGAGLYGQFQNISYQLQIGIMDAEADGGLAKKFNDIVKTRIDVLRPETAFIFSLQSNDLINGLRIGGSFAKWDWGMDLTIFRENYDWISTDVIATSDDEALLWTVGIEYSKNRFLFCAEYSIFDVTTPLDIYLTPTSAPLRMPVATQNIMEGYYANISYRFTSWFEIGFYHSIFYSNKKNRNGKDNVRFYGWQDYYSWSKDSCLSLRFDINESWIFKLEGHYNDGVYNAYISDNIDDNGNEDLTRYWFLYAAKMLYVF